MLRMVFIGACLALGLTAQTRRALIIGINQYQSSTGAVIDAPSAIDTPHRTPPSKVARPPVSGRSRGGWQNLEGAVPDALAYRQMLIDVYHVPPENIIFLTDKKNAQDTGLHAAGVATAQRILDTFQTHLIDEAKPGDISLFIYAGHGSRTHNDKSDEYDKLDQTIVPADSEDGTPDIRDKELSRLYQKAASKKILLTVIADSCHSGGLSRGGGPPVVTRRLENDPHTVSDPSDVDPKSTVGSGYLLVLTAALDTQSAEEMIDANGNHRGVFSYFFQQAIRDGSPNDAVDRIFQRTVALMRNSGRMQVPNEEGTGRLQESILGTPASQTGGISAVVQEIHGGRIILRGGKSLGLEKGCELLLNGNQESTRIRISEDPSLALSTAEVLSPKGAKLEAGNTFVLDHWVIPADSSSSFYLPSDTLSSDELAASTQTIRKVTTGWNWIDDPTLKSPDAVVRFSDGQWEVQRNRTKNSSVVRLGRMPSKEGWTSALADPTPGGVFIDFPPTKEFAEAIRSKADPHSTAVIYTATRAAALYHLTGRLATPDGQLAFQYAWLLSNADHSDEGLTALPIRTDWFTASEPSSAAELLQRTMNITRLRLWLTVAVPGNGTKPFPYRLGLKNQKTGEWKTFGRLVEGEIYDLDLQADAAALHAASQDSLPQWVYVAAIDQKGAMRPIYPRQQINSGENRLPREGLPTEITLRSGIPIGEPFGTDSLILITSRDEEIPLSALQIDPVATRGAPEGSRGARGSLSALLFSMQGASRGLYDQAAQGPSDWSVQRVMFRSIRKSEAKPQ